MANTIIQLKNSGVPGNVPNALYPGELAINYNDGKLYYGNSSNYSILFDAVTEPSGLDSEIQFNTFGSFGASANLKFDYTNKILLTDNVTSKSVAVTDYIQFRDGSKQYTANSGSGGGGFPFIDLGFITDAIPTYPTAPIFDCGSLS